MEAEAHPLDAVRWRIIDHSNYAEASFFLKTVRACRKHWPLSERQLARIFHRRVQMVDSWLAGESKPRAKDRTYFLRYAAKRFEAERGVKLHVPDFNAAVNYDRDIFFRYMEDMELSCPCPNKKWGFLADD